MISGLGGSNALSGGAGADTLEGGDGADFLMGQEGVDLMLGGANNDTVRSDVGYASDTIDGDDVGRVRLFRVRQPDRRFDAGLLIVGRFTGQHRKRLGQRRQRQHS